MGRAYARWIGTSHRRSSWRSSRPAGALEQGASLIGLLVVLVVLGVTAAIVVTALPSSTPTTLPTTATTPTTRAPGGHTTTTTSPSILSAALLAACVANVQAVQSAAQTYETLNGLKPPAGTLVGDLEGARRPVPAVVARPCRARDGAVERRHRRRRPGARPRRGGLRRHLDAADGLRHHLAATLVAPRRGPHGPDDERHGIVTRRTPRVHLDQRICQGPVTVRWRRVQPAAIDRAAGRHAERVGARQGHSNEEEP